tara:strand:- start:796 stop:933 length:138 start_codon:yes stop_codon:yes gene_type:complete
MTLLYSIFACSVLLAGLIIVISIIRGSHADTSGKNAFQFTPEEHF